ncbi:MAG: hypothetical protein JWM58_894 [Rhizobium sp.]|nr:hypothetical protein [Rhizobium sp.]
MDAVTIDNVDREIRGNFLRLRFARNIEHRFVEEYAASRSKLAPLWMCVGLAMYLFMLVDDYNLTPDVFWPLVIARTCIFAPIAMLGVWAVTQWPKAIHYDLLSLWVGVIGSLLPMSIMTFSHSEHLYIYQNGNVAASMFFVIVLRPRFPVAVIGLVLMAIIHAVTARLTGAFDEMTYSSIISFIVMVAVFMAAGAYFLDHIDRMNFLHQLRGSLLHAQLEQKAERDELTGLLNRRSLTRISGSIWSAPNGTVAAIMLDIDRFKLFNDVHGHIEGDACIRAVSRCIADQVNGAGAVFRYGGEEILVLITDTDLLSAMGAAEGIRAAIEALRIQHRGVAGDHVVTASLGVASVRPAEYSLEELLKLADDALYDAKRKGRNAVSISNLGAGNSLDRETRDLLRDQIASAG